jgi:hypothetical protein
MRVKLRGTAERESKSNNETAEKEEDIPSTSFSSRYTKCRKVKKNTKSTLPTTPMNSKKQFSDS